MPITHSKVSTKADSADTSLIRPSDWNADHVGGLDNPMTTAGDLIVGGASGTPARLALGASNTILASDGVQARWDVKPSGSSGLTDPMTTAGDIIVRNASNVTARLGIGASNTVLTSIGSGQAPLWAAVPSGGSGITVDDEGTPLSTAATTLDFVGAGVTASGTGATKTITIPGGGGVTQAYVGYNTVGGSVESATGSRQYMKSITLASACFLSSIDAHIKGNATNVAWAWACVCDDNSGTIGNLIGALSTQSTDALFLNSTYRWYSTPMGIYLPAGTYWIGYIFDPAISIHYDGSGSDRYMDTGGWVSDGDRYTQTNSTNKYSIRGNTFA